ncbi:hypothetical protein ALT_5186 [Aspergillus lentulus]|uniref:SAP domain-containing protein n=1 Tax=Aspergillus lentulus TaxID=293939 RepID=A0AAN4TAW7_ASPLE|nr:hypothetical protein CNMCM6069_001995 [Aspergillus lentulus]KAF4168696.1 hypothetical protein CNMCM6936_001571 [Aspergillus lentulus]KAF4173328.1 hypothetical protein CNMCM8060_000240 [Aspergillus lentulus]KAF4180824.1 hypothetical protein CNMCM7927_001001 [Aspergillus lentulus]KAF4191776.1 hypothetical protein CNMCM8694_001363 [Aspergillus lentulus]
MAAPRSTSLRALRVLSQQHTTTPCVRRSLHITGANSAQPVNVTDKASFYATRTLADLKLECKKRSIASNGTQAELVERLSNHDFLQSRAFSIAMKRINGSSSTEYARPHLVYSSKPSALTSFVTMSSPSVRHFNTSRAAKAVGDSSTVDFAYFPSMEEIDAPPSRPDPRFPILSDIYKYYDPSKQSITSDPPMKPQVYTVSGEDVAASPMSEVVDNHSMDIDPFSLTETVGRSRFGEELQRQQNGSQAKEPGIVRELWSGFLEDLLGPKQQTQRK